jgi:putative transposase
MQGLPLMPQYRRCRVPGGTVFFTVVTERRSPLLCGALARSILGDVFRACEKRWPFRVDGMVLLPDHLHSLWTLPPGDDAYSRRWGWIKKEFTKLWLAAGGEEQERSASRRRSRRRGVWQRRFWEHTIRDDDDYARHLDYIHYNPVKHSLVTAPRDWPYSSFHRWVRKGVYPPDWGAGNQVVDFSDLETTAMEPAPEGIEIGSKSIETSDPLCGRPR